MSLPSHATGDWKGGNGGIGQQINQVSNLPQELEEVK